MVTNQNTSKKKLKNLEKAGGWDPHFKQTKNEHKEKILKAKPDHAKAAAFSGNRPQSATRKTRTREFIRRKNRNAGK